MTASALHSLYGGTTARNALAGTVGGQKRVQEVWTPEWILAAAAEALGGTIVLDPCGATSYDGVVVDRKGKETPITGGWFARLTLVEPGHHEGVLAGPHGGAVIAACGKTAAWHEAGPAFVNPPYNELAPWMKKCAHEGSLGLPIVLLCPVRTRRVWWCRYAQTGHVVLLGYDVRFKGWPCAHPENLALISWNCTIPDLGARETWRIGCLLSNS